MIEFIFNTLVGCWKYDYNLNSNSTFFLRDRRHSHCSHFHSLYLKEEKIFIEKLDHYKGKVVDQWMWQVQLVHTTKTWIFNYGVRGPHRLQMAQLVSIPAGISHQSPHHLALQLLEGKGVGKILPGRIDEGIRCSIEKCDWVPACKFPAYIWIRYVFRRSRQKHVVVTLTFSQYQVLDMIDVMQTLLWKGCWHPDPDF